MTRRDLQRLAETHRDPQRLAETQKGNVKVKDNSEESITLIIFLYVVYCRFKNGKHHDMAGIKVKYVLCYCTCSSLSILISFIILRSKM